MVEAIVYISPRSTLQTKGLRKCAEEGDGSAMNRAIAGGLPERGRHAAKEHLPCLLD